MYLRGADAGMKRQPRTVRALHKASVSSTGPSAASRGRDGRCGADGRRLEAAGARAARAHRNAPMFLGSSWHHTSSARAYCDTTCARARAGCTMRPRCRRRPPRRRARPHLHDQVVREGRELLQAHEDRVADAPGASRVAARARPSARVRAPGPARLVWTGSRRRARALAPPNRRAQSAPVRGSCPSMRRHSRQERPGGPAHACGRPT